jgi:hypothetical protein
LDASFVFSRKINSVDTFIPQRKGKYITLLRGLWRNAKNGGNF